MNNDKYHMVANLFENVFIVYVFGMWVGFASPKFLQILICLNSWDMIILFYISMRTSCHHVYIEKLEALISQINDKRIFFTIPFPFCFPHCCDLSHKVGVLGYYFNRNIRPLVMWSGKIARVVQASQLRESIQANYCFLTALWLW